MRNKPIYFIVPLMAIGLFIILAISYWHIYPNDSSDKEAKGNSTHRIYINHMEDGFLYFPTIVDENNNSIIEPDQYFFKNGKGEVAKVIIDDIEYLNISSKSDEIIIESYRMDILNGNKLTYGNWNNYSFEIPARSTRIYYSGVNEIYVISEMKIGRSHDICSLDLGPAYIIHGWNDVMVLYQTYS